MQDDIKTPSNKLASTMKRPPARTPEAQEQKMINLAMKQAEKMLEKGQASSQIVVHFLKLATEKTKLENEKLKADITVSQSKADVMQSQKHSEELYQKAIQAFTSYGGLRNSQEDSELYSNDEEDFDD